MTELTSCFLSPLRVEELPDGRKRLLADLVFYSSELDQDDTDPAGGILVIPTGTITNYASVPWGVRNTFPQGGPWKWAATLHDAASHGDVLTEAGGRVHLVKRVTDRLFYEAMNVPPCDQVPRWQRWLMYKLVVLFGSGAYGGTAPLVVPVVGVLDSATPIGDAIDRLGSSGDGFDATVRAQQNGKPEVSVDGWFDFGKRDQFGAGGSVSWAQKAWAAIARVTWRPGKK